MNFNLISPDGNGYDYQTRFREDIVIKPNSKVYLNFASLSQRVGIELQTDQKIYITSNNLLPKYNLNTLTDANTLDEETTIKAGKYSLNEFKDEIKKSLNSLVSPGTPANTKNQLGIYRVEELDFNPQDNIYEDYISIGYQLTTRRIPRNNIALDGTNILNFGVVGGNRYVKTDATTPDYSSYGMSQRRYFHYNLSKPNSNLDEEKAVMFCSQKVSDFSSGEKVGFGLYSSEYMSVFSGGTPIISGANLELQNGVPQVFVWVEITHQLINIYVAEDSSNNSIDEWTTFDTEIAGMRRIYSQSIMSVFDYDDIPQLELETYFNISDGDFKEEDKKLYFRVNDGINNRTIFDSYDDGFYYFPSDFFTISTDPPTTVNEAYITIPFKILMSSNTQNLGWRQVVLGEWVKTPRNAGDTKPNSIIEKYNLSFDEELSKYLNISVGSDTNDLYPNFKDISLMNEEISANFLYLTNLNLDFLNSSYTCYIEELPTTNYKNTETNANGGYSQNILANIPAPFSNLVSNTTKDNSIITGLYQPNFQIVSNMKNQGIRSNHFRVIIKRMEDDKPATELLRSVINFTILEE